MASCERFLWKFVEEVEPTSTQKDRAQRSHWYLRDLLKTGNFEDRIRRDFLSGSYARDTAIAPLDDVDIVFVVDPNVGWARPWFGGLPDPNSISEAFARAIRYRYESSTAVVQRRSVRLELYHLDIDVVPAVEEGREGFLRIPDAVQGSWIITAPEVHSKTATVVNKAREGRFKPLVKLLKFWNSNLPSTARFKSFAIETMAVRIFSEVQLPNLEHGLIAFFDVIAWLDGKGLVRRPQNFGIDLGFWGNRVDDVAGTGSNVVAGVDRDRRNRFVAHAIRSRDRLVSATEARLETTAAERAAEALRMP